MRYWAVYRIEEWQGRHGLQAKEKLVDSFFDEKQADDLADEIGRNVIVREMEEMQ